MSLFVLISRKKRWIGYTCSINNDKKVGLYTAKTAPIILPVNTPGYMAQTPPSTYNSNGLIEYLDQGFIYLFIGMRGRSNEYNDIGDLLASGGAPWGVTDLKAGIRYYRFNSMILPRDSSSIFSFGMSGGGDSRIIKPLYNLLKNELSNSTLYVITGENTFSSALMNAIELSTNYDGILVGSPTGGKPNHYGEVKSTQLPTGNRISWSTNYFTMIPGDNSDSLYPQIPIEIPSTDFFSLKDTILDSILQMD